MYFTYKYKSVMKDVKIFSVCIDLCSRFIVPNVPAFGCTAEQELCSALAGRKSILPTLRV